MFKVLEITIVKGLEYDFDTVTLTTDLTSGLWPYNEATMMQFKVRQGSGEAYAKANFVGVPYKLIDPSEDEY